LHTGDLFGSVCCIGTEHMSACHSEGDLVMWTDILYCHRGGVSCIT
jgi:hypothetical protein